MGMPFLVPHFVQKNGAATARPQGDSNDPYWTIIQVNT
jgi:hypothetical protein